MVGKADEVLGEQAALAIAYRKVGKAVQVALSPGQREIEGESASARRRAHSRIQVFAEVLTQPFWNEFILLPREVNQIAVVASKQLVAPISRECHRHMPPSCARNVVCRHMEESPNGSSSIAVSLLRVSSTFGSTMNS